MEVTDYDLYRVPPRWQLLRIETDEGIVGWGEPVVEGRAETTATAVERLLNAYLLGKDPRNIARHWERMYRGGFYRGGPVLMSALSGIDQALWDIKGKALGVPVYELLGGKARDRIRLYQHIQGKSPEELAADAQEQLDNGFTMLKFPPTHQLAHVDSPDEVDEAYRRLEAVREVVGKSVDIGLDFHGRVSKPMAKRLVKELEPLSPMFYEEPVTPEYDDDLDAIAQHTTVPIATGERLYSRTDFKPLFEAGTVDIIQPDVSHAGGITEVLKIASMADAYDIGLAPHSPLGPVALAASLHVDAVAPNAIVQEQLLYRPDAPDYLEDSSRFDYDDEGYVKFPAEPGLGVTPDIERLEAAETDETWDVPHWSHPDGSVAEW